MSEGDDIPTLDPRYGYDEKGGRNMAVIWDYGDYLAAAARHDILEYERRVADGLIKMTVCPECKYKVPVRSIQTGEHERICAYDTNPDAAV